MWIGSGDEYKHENRRSHWGIIITMIAVIILLITLILVLPDGLQGGGGGMGNLLRL